MLPFQRRQSLFSRLPEWAKNVVYILAVLATLGACADILLAPTDRRPVRVDSPCLSNLKQIGLAMTQYLADYDGGMPPTEAAHDPRVTWRAALAPYVQARTDFLCPSRPKSPTAPDGFASSYVANVAGTNGLGGTPAGRGAFSSPPALPLRQEQFRTPTTLIAICEATAVDHPGLNIDAQTNAAKARPLLWAGHAGGSNYLLADGHAQWARPLDTTFWWYRDSSRPLSLYGREALAQAQKTFR